MLIFKAFITTLLVGFCLSAQAKTVIVADIDDTLKVAHIRSVVAKVTYAPQINARFAGMRELLNSLKANIADVEVIYLSNANEMLMGESHREFLDQGFPKGLVLLKGMLSGANHKIDMLRRIHASRRADHYILLGDNGQEDTRFYGTFAQEVRNVARVQTYIRPLYDDGARLLKGQTAFITPVEIMLDLNLKGYVTQAVLDRYVNWAAPQIVKEKNAPIYTPMFFPRWMTCTKFRWSWPRQNETPAIAGVRRKVEAVCRDSAYVIWKAEPTI